MATPLPRSFCFPPKTEEEQKHDTEVYQKYIEIIKTLPTSHCWPCIPFQQYQGLWLPGGQGPLGVHGQGLQGIMAAQDHFTSLPGDILICSLLKVGTTWLKALAFAAANRTNTPFPLSSLLTNNPHDCVPSLETMIYDGQRIGDPSTIPTPRLLATHMHHHMLPPSVLDPAGSCKIVYICRNPRDTFISLWKFVNNIAPNFPVEIEQALDCFVSGVIWSGPYWDHVKGFWQASRDDPQRVLFMRYEEMQRDTTRELKRLADFMGCAFSPEEETGGTVEKLVEMCSFKSLSGLKVNIDGARKIVQPWSYKNSAFFRKGVVGDWKNHLTPEMVERLDRAVEEKLEGCGLSFVACYDV